MRRAKLKPGQVPNKRLRRERYINGLSQEELAEKVTKILGRKTSGQAISNIETGVVSNPRISMKRAISQALGIPIETLFPLADDLNDLLEDRKTPAA